MFSEKGFDAGTMRDIAARVGVTEPAIYRHFASKEDLFLSLLEAVAERIRAEMGALFEQFDVDDVPGSVQAIFADRRAAIGDYGPALRTIVLAVAHNPTLLEAYRDAVALPMREKITDLVMRVDRRYGIERPAQERDALVRTLVSLAVGAMVTSVVLGDEPDTATATVAMRIMGWGDPGSQ